MAGAKKVFAVMHTPHEPLGLWQEEMERWRVPLSVVRIWEGQPLPDPGAVLGAIVLGGPMNVDQTAEHSFLSTELEWIKALSAADRHVLGVCLGAQLLAAALGARVTPGPQAEIGFRSVNLTPAGAEDKLLSGFPMSLPVFQWHRQGFDLPPGAELLAYTADYPCQAFRWKKSWGFQFHMEITAELVRDWSDLARRDPGETSEKPAWDKLRAQIDSQQQMVALHGRQMIRRFWDSIAEF